jgi:hypothetical protein
MRSLPCWSVPVAIPLIHDRFSPHRSFDTTARGRIIRSLHGPRSRTSLLVSRFSTEWRLCCRCVYTFTAAYGISYGPIGWVLPSEVFPLSIRSRGVAVSTASNWVNNCPMRFCAMDVRCFADPSCQSSSVWSRRESWRCRHRTCVLDRDDRRRLNDGSGQRLRCSRRRALLDTGGRPRWCLRRQGCRWRKPTGCSGRMRRERSWWSDDR